MINPHPLRVQRRMAKGWRKPEGAVYVGRPSEWGNPFKLAHIPATAPGETTWYRVYDTGNRSRILRDEPVLISDPGAKYLAARFAADHFDLHTGPLGLYAYDDAKQARLLALAGRHFMCWCGLDAPCHGDVLLHRANPDIPWQPYGEQGAA